MPTARTAGGPSTTRTRQRREVEPPFEAAGVAGDLDPGDAAGVRPKTRIWNRVIAAQEEREERLARGLRQAGQPRAQPGAPDRGDGRSEPPGDGLDVVHRDDPAQEPVAAVGESLEKAPPELRPCRLVRIGHSQELEIAAAERDDAVACAQTFVASARAGLEPKLALDPRGRRIEVGGRIDHVIDPHVTKLALCGV
jgi:hypothetical protein